MGIEVLLLMIFLADGFLFVGMGQVLLQRRRFINESFTKTEACKTGRQRQDHPFYVAGLCCRTEQQQLTEEFLVYWKGFVLL